METDHSKLYRIQSEPSHFYAGHFPDGTQVLMGIGCPTLVAVLFDGDGRVSNVLKKEFSQDTQLGLESDSREERASMVVKFCEELDQWSRELGLIEGVIDVQKFSLPEIRINIQDLPSIYLELLEDEEGLDEETKEDIRYWQQGNLFVLVWGNEYYIDSEGRVEST